MSSTQTRQIDLTVENLISCSISLLKKYVKEKREILSSILREEEGCGSLGDKSESLVIDLQDTGRLVDDIERTVKSLDHNLKLTDKKIRDRIQVILKTREELKAKRARPPPPLPPSSQPTTTVVQIRDSQNPGRIITLQDLSVSPVRVIPTIPTQMVTEYQRLISIPQQPTPLSIQTIPQMTQLFIRPQLATPTHQPISIYCPLPANCTSQTIAPTHQLQTAIVHQTPITQPSQLLSSTPQVIRNVKESSPQSLIISGSPPEYKCPFCGIRNFNAQGPLTRHIKVDHPELQKTYDKILSLTPTSVVNDPNMIGGNVKCFYCPFRERSKAPLLRHIEEQHKMQYHTFKTIAHLKGIKTHTTINRQVTFRDEHSLNGLQNGCKEEKIEKESSVTKPVIQKQQPLPPQKRKEPPEQRRLQTSRITTRSLASQKNKPKIHELISTIRELEVVLPELKQEEIVLCMKSKRFKQMEYI